MPTNIERLLDVAKRLDEMADDGPSELTTLSDEIGKIAASLEDRPRSGPPVPMPRWMQDIQYIVERNAEEIAYHTRGKHPRGYRERDRLDAQIMSMMSMGVKDLKTINANVV